MDVFNGHGRLRALVVGGALSAALALPIAVFADTTGGGIQPASSRGATITLDAVHFKSKVLATVDISFTCDPIQVYDFETGTWTTTTSGQVDDASATIVQASGRSIASASGDSFGGLVTCDGSTVYTREIDIVASSAPFKAGAAVAGATIGVGTPDSGSGGGNFASSGPVTVRIVK